MPRVQLSHLQYPRVLEYGQRDEYLAAVEPCVDGGESVEPVAVRVSGRDVDEDEIGGHQQSHPARDGGAGDPEAESDVLTVCSCKNCSAVFNGSLSMGFLLLWTFIMHDILTQQD